MKAGLSLIELGYETLTKVDKNDKVDDLVAQRLPHVFLK